MEVVEDLMGILKVYRDGSIFRVDVPQMFAQASDHGEGGVKSKDVVLNDKLGLWVRIYMPFPSTHQRKTCNRMPLLLYFHGGGFCLASPALPDFHNMCVKLAASVGVMIVSVAYRLAPEHRLPAAYHDCLAAFNWLRSHALKDNTTRVDGQRETWVERYADLDNIFLLGDSAGANIIHQFIVMLPSGRREGIRGGILLQPFFGAEERKPSEVECPKDAFLNLELNDAYWRLALPLASHRDHSFCNPFLTLEQLQMDFPPLLVAIGGRDMLRDRGMEYCEALKKMGKEVEVIVFEEEEHCFYALKLHSNASNLLMHRISRFITSAPAPAAAPPPPPVIF